MPYSLIHWRLWWWVSTPTMNANISPGVCYTFQSLVSFQYMYITFSSNRPKSNVLVSIIITNRMSDRRNIWGFPCDSALIHVQPLYIMSYIIHHIFFFSFSGSNAHWLLVSSYLFSFQASMPVNCYWIVSPFCCKCMQCMCEEGFCYVLLVWNLLCGPHELGYIYLLPQSSPLAQYSTATIHAPSRPAL